jgi:multidrug resistance protein, MATE family
MAHAKKMDVQRPRASINEVITISMPLIISQCSNSMMTIIDRLFVAHISLHAMNAVVVSGMTMMIFVILGLGITGIAEVFVGQYHGAQKNTLIGAVIWQMIWFALSLSILYIPLGIWGGPWLLPPTLYHEGAAYFRILMCGGTLFALTTALTAFYAGRGKTHIITYVTIIGNLINIGLDYLLIFGHPPYLPRLGAAGAAWATLSAQGIQILIYLGIFLHPKMNRLFKTHTLCFDWPIIKKCIQLGAPKPIGHLFEFTGWVILFHWVAHRGSLFTSILTMGQTLFLLFNFLIDGLSNGITVIAANYLGAKKQHLLKRLLKSTTIVHLAIMAMLILPIIIYPHPFLVAFSFEFNLKHASQTHLDQQVLWAFRYVWGYLLLDGLVWIVAGVLTAAGDTRFIMLCNALCTWLFALLPAYLLLHYQPSFQPSTLWLLFDGYAMGNLLIIYWRFSTTHWEHNKVLA